ncbi:MAG TPA: T9SS type A sorting domain-containing protein [Moheibacter sp.]|nr:T9SS type A sorting domain-containing protein [Moheibacter sp.]
MRKNYLLLMTLLSCGSVFSQNYNKVASMNEQGEITVKEIQNLNQKNSNLLAPELTPFLEFGAPSHFIKNTRGLTLADLDGDGTEELIFGINEKLYALKGDGTLLFEKEMGLPVLLPPAVADLNNDGKPEIVLNYGYASTGGAITVLDNTGHELPGWPVNFNNRWMINAPALADVNGDGIMEIVTGERVSGTVGRIHILKIDGTSFSQNWPVEIGSTPAFTPSIGDVNGDGNLNIVIAGSSTGMNVFDLNGENLPGFPLVETGVSYSYQSPMLVDLDGDGKLEIVGSNHGDNSRFYVMKHDGTFHDGWPIPLDNWTFSPPSVADVNGDGNYEIFMGIPNLSEDGTDVDVVYGLNANGSNMNGFPIMKNDGGNEGVITIADINNDGIPDIIFGNNTTDSDGKGYLHAFSSDGSGQLEGFPLRPKGMTFMNGAVVGDIDGDGMMDISMMSYSLFTGAVDSTFVHAYNLNVPYDPAKIIRNGYKGSNTRDGLIQSEAGMGVMDLSLTGVQIYPNPSTGELNIQLSEKVKQLEVNVFDLTGRKVFHQKETATIQNTAKYNLEQLPSGTYIIQVKANQKLSAMKWIKK